MKLRKLIRNFFGFSKAETNGFLVLIPLLLIVLFSKPVYRNWLSNREVIPHSDKVLLDSLVANWEKNSGSPTLSAINKEKKLFAFDPNKISKEEFITLGFPTLLAERTVRYVEKGGKFRTQKDLLKIYGMDSLLYEELRPYITLPEKVVREPKAQTYATREKSIKPKPLWFDINTADTTQLKKIYGIGEKLSLRILKYRESLGGFIQEEQLQEVYGLDSAVVKRILKQFYIADDFQPKQLSLNTANEEELDKHPYLNKKEAGAIIAYRFQHGSFTTIDDLQKIQLLDKNTIAKMHPYLLAN
jgi:competence ComEA-like helix-hairpin-helix protein